MSLVYEALQKAAREKNRFAPPPAEPLQPAQPDPGPVVSTVTPQRSGRLWIGLSVAAAAVMVAGAVVFTRKPADLSPSPTPPASAVTVSEVVRPVPPAAVAAVPVIPPATGPVSVAEKSAAPDTRFKLTGIMRLGGEYSAVINGHVVARDQTVNGAIVKLVTADRVTLSVDGREIVVPLF